MNSRKSHSIIPGRALACALIAFMAMLGACSKAVPADVLAHADDAIARGDTVQALVCCQSLDDAALTPSQLCQRALIYAKLAQVGNNPEHMASAAASLVQAIEQNEDSVIYFASTLGLADITALNEIFSLIGSADDEIDEASFYDESADSLLIAP